MVTSRNQPHMSDKKEKIKMWGGGEWKRELTKFRQKLAINFN